MEVAMRILDFFTNLFDDRKSNAKAPVCPFRYPEVTLYYPGAAQTDKMITQGKYPRGYPEGCVIHYNAGRFDPLDFLHYMRSKKYVCFVIDRLGHVWQEFPLDEWGFHAGKSYWRGISPTVHTHFVGIEVMSAGELHLKKGKWTSWFGTTYPENEVRIVDDKAFHAFTEVQEDSLKKLILWLYHNNDQVFSFKNVVGHHEVSPGRKSDPGGALSMSMPAYRAMLWNIAESR